MLERAISLLGVFVMLALAFALCPKERRKHVRAKTVGIALGLLFVLSVLLLRTPVRGLFRIANDLVERLLGFSRDGATFVFGNLITDTASFGFIFAFQVLPTILFFSALMSLLYHFRVLPFVVERLGRFLARTLGTSGPESFSTVADIFVGQSEAPLVIKPYLAKMTLSELNACMVAGFATTAGGVLAAYVVMLQDEVPGIAGHLIACSVLGAPASLAIAKLVLPETNSADPLAMDVSSAVSSNTDSSNTGSSNTDSSNADSSGSASAANGSSSAVSMTAASPSTSANALEALATGTADGIKLAVNVGAMLIVFLALVAMVNAGLSLVGGWFGAELSLERLLGWAFAPLAFFTGVPREDVLHLGTLLGQKTALNEFVAYAHLNTMLERDPSWLTERGRVIASYALCGFANFGSVGIQIASYSSLAPERRADFSRLALRAMGGGLLATTLIACVVGVVL